MLKKLWRFYLLNKKYLGSLPRSFYYNLRLLPFSQAIRFPIFLSNHVSVNLKSGARVEISAGRIHAGLIKIGYTQCDFFKARHHKSILDIGVGRLVFEGGGNIGAGVKLSIDNDGILILGSQFWTTGPILIVARKLIQFGYNCVLSWNITIMDHDAHNVFDGQSNIVNEEKAIIIGDHVWVGCNSTILKGARLSNNVVVGSNSVVTRGIDKPNIVLVGNPAVIKKENITWGDFD